MEENGRSPSYNRLLGRLKQEFQGRFSGGESLRSLAKHLEIDPGTVSRILSGKRRLNPQQTIAILDKLEFESSEKKKMLQLLIADSLSETVDNFVSKYRTMTHDDLPKDIVASAIENLNQQYM